MVEQPIQNVMPVIEAFKKLTRENASVGNMNDEQLTDGLTATCERLEAPARQSIAWLTKTFPKAQLNMYLHDTADSYQQYIARENLQSPDVIATADIEDEMSQAQLVMRCWQWLSRRRL